MTWLAVFDDRISQEFKIFPLCKCLKLKVKSKSHCKIGRKEKRCKNCGFVYLVIWSKSGFFSMTFVSSVYILIEQTRGGFFFLVRVGSWCLQVKDGLISWSFSFANIFGFFNKYKMAISAFFLNYWL